MSNSLKSSARRVVRVISSEEPHYERDMPLEEALRLAQSDLGEIVSGEIVLRNERGDDYTLTFDDNE